MYVILHEICVLLIIHMIIKHTDITGKVSAYTWDILTLNTPPTGYTFPEKICHVDTRTHPQQYGITGSG